MSNARFIWKIKDLVESSEKGGPGSGNHGHRGRPGERGGSGGGGGFGSEDGYQGGLIPNEKIKVAKVDTSAFDLNRVGKLGTQHLGQCFNNAGGFALDNALTVQGNVVHGHIHIFGTVAIAHGWVELPGDIVFDGTQSQFFDKADYYKVTKAVKEHEYSLKDAVKKMFESRHFGPWEPVQGISKEARNRRTKEVSQDELQPYLSEMEIPLTDADLALAAKGPVTKGEEDGHPFRGNQYTTGESGGESKGEPKGVNGESAPFESWGKNDWNKEDGTPMLTGWHAFTGGGAKDGPIFGNTEGNGFYMARDKDTAAFFGKPKIFAFAAPKNPLLVDNESLYLLMEDDALEKPVLPGDSAWTRLNKEAYKEAMETGGGWNGETTTLAGTILTRLAKEAGYDSVLVSTGSEQWAVLFDKVQLYRANHGKKEFDGDSISIKGEEEGHPFRGNQYTQGQSDGEDDETVFKGEKANPNGKDTLEQYQNPDGTWTKERQALHDEIIESFFKGKTPVDEPVSYLLGGGPAAGKTTVARSGDIKLPENMVLAAGDDIKAMFPEYKAAIKNKDVMGAVFVHEESSYLSKKIMARAASEKYNLLLDGTGDSGLRSVSSKVAAMRARGQKVMGIYVTTDVELAVSRSIERAKKTGRGIPESVVRETHKAVSGIFPQLVKEGLMDSMDLYDTTAGGKPVKIFHADGKNGKVLDEEKYARFLAKAG